MKPETTFRCMAVFAGILLATMTAVSGQSCGDRQGNVSVAPNVFFQLHFVVAHGTAGLNVVQSEWAPSGASLSFQTTMTLIARLQHLH